MIQPLQPHTRALLNQGHAKARAELANLIDQYSVAEAFAGGRKDETHAAFLQFMITSVAEHKAEHSMTDSEVVQNMIVWLSEAIYDLRDCQERHAPPDSPRCQHPIGAGPAGRLVPCARVVRDDRCEFHGHHRQAGGRRGDPR